MELVVRHCQFGFLSPEVVPGAVEHRMTIDTGEAIARMGQQRKVFAILAATAAVFAVAAPAYAWPHVYWKPARMAAAIVAARYPIDTSQATCRGVGKPLKGRYASFVCVATRIISDGQTSHPASTTVWARPLPSGRFCASGISLAKCRTYGP